LATSADQTKRRGNHFAASAYKIFKDLPKCLVDPAHRLQHETTIAIHLE
jgi:hypothetical protein